MRRLLLLLLFFASHSWATDYYWLVSGIAGGTHYPSYVAGCQAYADNAATISATSIVKLTYAEYESRPTSTGVRCYAWLANGQRPDTMIYRYGDSCASGTTYSDSTGACTPPSDAECKVRSSYTKVVQYSAAEGAAVISVDPEIKDGCIYEPSLDFANCTESQCTVDMQPVGNTDMSDNSDNPDQELQDYLDELAKQFTCQKTENGTVGCTNAEQTTPDVDPNNQCPDGYSWSGTACFPTSGTGNENPDSGSGDSGSSSGGSSGGSDSGSGSTGGDSGSSGNGSSSGGGGGSDSDVDAPKETLKEPAAGNWDAANTAWDQRVEDAKSELKQKVNQNIAALKGTFDLNLGTGGGSLPCDSFQVMGKTQSLCFDSYDSTLSGMRNALLLICSVIAAFVILKD